MTEHDDLSRSLRVLAASAPASQHSDELVRGVQQRAEVLHRRRRRMATGTAGVLVVASVAAGVGLSGGRGGSTITSPGDGTTTESALPACPPPTQTSKGATDKGVDVAGADKAKSEMVANAVSEAGTGALPPSAISVDKTTVSGAKGHAIIDAVGDGTITFHFAGAFGADPNFPVENRQIEAKVDENTEWLSSGSATSPQTLTVGQEVELAVVDSGDGSRVELVNVNPPSTDALPGASGTEMAGGAVINATVKGDVSATGGREPLPTATEGSNGLVTVAKGTVESWAPDKIVIAVAYAKPSLVLIPDAATVTTASGATCSPVPLAAGTEVLVKASSTDGVTWRLVSLDY